MSSRDSVNSKNLNFANKRKYKHLKNHKHQHSSQLPHHNNQLNSSWSNRIITPLQNQFKHPTWLSRNNFLTIMSHPSKLNSSSLNNTNRNYLFICRKKIKLTNNNSTATSPKNYVSNELALVEGVVLKKGSSIRFKI